MMAGDLALGGVLRRRRIQLIDFQHRSDRSNAGDRFLGELADAECERANELAVNVNRAAAHSGNYTGIFRLFSVETNQDDVALRSGHIA